MEELPLTGFSEWLAHQGKSETTSIFYTARVRAVLRRLGATDTWGLPIVSEADVVDAMSILQGTTRSQTATALRWFSRYCGEAGVFFPAPGGTGARAAKQVRTQSCDTYWRIIEGALLDAGSVSHGAQWRHIRIQGADVFIGNGGVGHRGNRVAGAVLSLREWAERAAPATAIEDAPVEPAAFLRWVRETQKSPEPD